MFYSWIDFANTCLVFVLHIIVDFKYLKPFGCGSVSDIRCGSNGSIGQVHFGNLEPLGCGILVNLSGSSLYIEISHEI